MRFEGVYVAVATPFAGDGGVDLAAMERHLDFLVREGVNGFVPCATTGESPTLSREERRKIIELCVRKANSRKLSVIAGCGGNSTSAVIELSREARDLGCQGALVVTPYYNKPTPKGLLAHYRAVADASDLPIVLYNVPARTNVNLAPELTAELFRHPRIVGIKEASGNYEQWVSLSRSVDLTTKSFMSGDDDCFAVILALGGSGIISASANVVPGLFVSIYRHAREDQWSKAFELQKRFFPLKKALFMETNPGPIKYALHLMGYAEDRLRMPLVPVEARTQEAVRAALTELEGSNDL